MTVPPSLPTAQAERERLADQLEAVVLGPGQLYLQGLIGRAIRILRAPVRGVDHDAVSTTPVGGIATTPGAESEGTPGDTPVSSGNAAGVSTAGVEPGELEKLAGSWAITADLTSNPDEANAYDRCVRELRATLRREQRGERIEGYALRLSEETRAHLFHLNATVGAGKPPGWTPAILLILHPNPESRE